MHWSGSDTLLVNGVGAAASLLCSYESISSSINGSHINCYILAKVIYLLFKVE